MSELLKQLDREIACVRREIVFRERAYPRLVATGKMSKAKADEELNTMRAVLDTITTTKVIVEAYATKRMSLLPK